MSTRYCTLGHQNIFTAIKPRFCAQCGLDMDAAFAAVTPGSITLTRPAVSKEPVERPMHPVTARRLARRGQVQSEATENDDGSDLYDENEMRARVQELAAGLAGSFSFGVDDTDNKTFKFGRLDNIQKLARDAEAAEAKTPKAKSKSGRK